VGGDGKQEKGEEKRKGVGRENNRREEKGCDEEWGDGEGLSCVSMTVLEGQNGFSNKTN
jgi:hypothetical protein